MNTIIINYSSYSETRGVSLETSQSLISLGGALETLPEGAPSFLREQLRGLIKRLLGLKGTYRPTSVHKNPEGTVVVSLEAKKKKPKPKPKPAPTAPVAGESLAHLWVRENPSWTGVRSFDDGSLAVKS